jgi:nucleoside-diphosphate-sugar epimerase
VRCDLRKDDEAEKLLEGAAIVVQAAATTSGAADIVNRPYHHVTDNAVMNSLLLRAAFEQKVRHLVFLSCSVMYHSSDVPLRESDFDANGELYPNYFGVGWTKVYVEKMCEFYARISDTRFTVIRHSNIYGPHDKFDLAKSHVFGATMTKVMKASEGRITVWGTGEEARDLLHVSDLVELVKAAIERQKDGFALYNAGLGKAIPIRDLVATIIAKAGKEIEIEYDLTQPTLKTSLCLDTTKARGELGWEPRIGLEEGIARTLEWYRENVRSGGRV